MKKILVLALSFLFLLNSSSVFAGRIGRVTLINSVSEDVYDVFLSEDTNATEPSSGDIRYELYVDGPSDVYKLGLLDTLRFAMENKEEYNCYISNGGYTSSGGQQYICFVQLLERTDGIKRDISRIKRDISNLQTQVKYLYKCYLYLRSLHSN